MELIETVTVGSGGAASITFSAIPDTYTDLYLVLSLRSSISLFVDQIRVYFNGANSNLSNRYLNNNGSNGSASSGSIAGFLGDAPGNSATANTFGNASMYVPNYTASNNKSFAGDTVMENNATASYIAITANLWNVTSAITSITLYPNIGPSWMAGSSASLYGITAGTDGVTAVS